MRRDYAEHGEQAYWQSREKSMAADAGTDPFDIAVIQSKLGETDAMFASLEKAYQKRSTELLYWMQTEPAFDKFRADPRFRDPMRRIGLAGTEKSLQATIARGEQTSIDLIAWRCAPGMLCSPRLRPVLPRAEWRVLPSRL